MSVMAGNQLFSLSVWSPFTSTLGQSSIGNGTPLLGMICLAIRTEPVSRPMSGTSALCFGCVLSTLQMNRALLEQDIGQPLDQHRIDDGRARSWRG